MLGVRANRVIMLAFALSGMLAAAVGLILATQTGTVDIQMGVSVMLVAFIATVIGGLGSLPGAVVAGLPDRRRQRADAGDPAARCAAVPRRLRLWRGHRHADLAARTACSRRNPQSRGCDHGRTPLDPRPHASRRRSSSSASFWSSRSSRLRRSPARSTRPSSRSSSASCSWSASTSSSAIPASSASAISASRASAPMPRPGSPFRRR